MADLKPMALTVVTPDDKAFEAKVKFISGRALDGDFGFYPNPAPHVVALDIAELDVTDQDDKKYKLPSLEVSWKSIRTKLLWLHQTVRCQNPSTQNGHNELVNGPKND